MGKVTLSPKFQVVIPKAIREKLGLSPGQKIQAFIYGDRIELTIVPETGTTATLNGKVVGTIEDDGFGRALLAVWLGDHPPSDGLKDGMLGK